MPKPIASVSLLRLQDAVVAGGGSPVQTFVVGGDGVVAIEVFESGLAYVRRHPKPSLYVLPSGAVAVEKAAEVKP